MTESTQLVVVTTRAQMARRTKTSLVGMLRGKSMEAAKIAHLINITVMLPTPLKMARELKKLNLMADRTGSIIKRWIQLLNTSLSKDLTTPLDEIKIRAMNLQMEG